MTSILYVLKINVPDIPESEENAATLFDVNSQLP